MKKCSVCNKNIAVVFATKIENGKSEMKGMCMTCAKKMGLPVIQQLMEQTGMTEEELESLSEEMDTTLEGDSIEGENDSNTHPLLSLFKGNNQTSHHQDQEEYPSNTKEEKEKNKSQKKSKGKKKNLEMYGTNLTEKANNKEVDRIIGRHREIDRTVQILNRRNKNNPILIGEPGVGKTAIAEGLAVRIVERQVPAKLFNTEVYLLDLTAIVAGTQFRGQFEGRMKAIIKEAQDCGNVILVIDEVHNIMGAGEVHGGVMNAANILKPALAKGEIQIIGATTLEEYRKHIEKDAALERRFQPVLVEEPTVEETIEIVKGIKNYYEEYHRVKIPQETIEAAVKLSEKYITDRYLPDKAIDVIDEAGSRANLKNQGLVELEALKEELENIQQKRQEAALGDDYEKAAQYKVEECLLLDKIKKIEEVCNDATITIEDVAFVIESWTKIPVQRITEKEAHKLLHLEDRLHKRIIGQNEAVKALAKAIRRNRSGFKKKRKPSSFIFVGPTGVGKTELVKALANELFGSEEALIRLDMSEYMEKHTTSKLIGAPPGYIGYDQGGQLTEKIRRKPYSVILMDEMEKAHPDVFNLLLQILEDGRLTDSEGRTVYFENAVIVMTSNIGTQLKSSGMGFGRNNYDAMEERVKEALKEAFRPEFLNRIDETIVFTNLTREERWEIIDLMLQEVIEEVEEKDMTLEVDQEVKAFILEKGYDERYGARPLRRTIQRHIEDEIAEAYLRGELREGNHIKVQLKKDHVVLDITG
ncbi:ATP-dependent Clp protease ATP-binding subunit [Natronincola ferrireducens]|uniref:ATPase family associated with various cellular activities (AAA) n=1 Tax=Natronincola ferrireducens TaxID=393762 RepID=A0A1G9F2W9_9FIRM|nr:ATP-dependent Clp protease ATP-binding subunit [Natronincola ferrireducens]SDK82688.1 ATPase family associated with various cellular activities (AAA) [Natronincola ferrireducens]